MTVEVGNDWREEDTGVTSCFSRDRVNFLYVIISQVVRSGDGGATSKKLYQRYLGIGIFVAKPHVSNRRGDTVYISHADYQDQDAKILSLCCSI